MPNDAADNGFQSVLAPFMDQFVQEKHACGYGYHELTRSLHRLDDFLVQEGLATLELPRSVARSWLAKKPHESASTQQQRIMVVRQFSRFLLRLGHSAYVPDSTLAARTPSTFVPRMLTDEELRKFFQAVDALEPTARSPLRHLIMPEVFRLLYGCGFRVREVLKLRVRDVDLNQGIITVRQGKFRKDRLVPPALSVVHRLRKYAGHFERRPSDAFFFPGPSGGPFALRTVYTLFVNCCCSVGFPMRGAARDPESTTIATYSPSIPYGVGIETGRISTPNYLFWPHISGINIFPELSVIFISPPKSFRKSQPDPKRPLATSFPGESNDEAHRFFHSRDKLLDPLLGFAAESQRKYDQGIPRRVYSSSTILPLCAWHRPGKATARTDRCFLGGSIPGLLGERKKVFAEYAEPSTGDSARIFQICSGGGAKPHASMPENPGHSSAAARSSNGRIRFERRTGRDSGAAGPEGLPGSKRCRFAECPL